VARRLGERGGGPYDGCAVQPPRFHVGKEVFTRIALVTLVALALLVVSGGAVRLTGSGLGCPDWPSCYQHRLTAAVSFHSLVEFLNRCVIVVVTVAVAVLFLAALARRPFRRDLVWLAGSLVIGIVVQIVLGGLVVLFKLNPYLVMCHFLVSLAMVALAVLLVHASRAEPTPAMPVVGRPIVWLGRVVVAVTCVVVAAGTVVTGSGPHAGAKVVARIPIAFRDAAELHSTLAVFLIGITLASLFALRAAGAPAGLQRHGRGMLEVMVVQGVLGWTQYALHDNPLVVGFHLAGATCVFIAVVAFYLAMHEHPVEVPAGTGVTAAPRARQRDVVATPA
jgi:cytochrome c oxidase assembly protein subunit 15